MRFIICGGSFPVRILRIFSIHLRPFLPQLPFASEIITFRCLTFFLTCQQVAFLVNISLLQFCYPRLSSCLFAATSDAIYILSHYSSHYALSHCPKYYVLSKCNKNVLSHMKPDLWLEHLLLKHNLSEYLYADQSRSQ
jgi:hypothetical protein